MANLGPMFLGFYESISKHMEAYEQNLVQKEGEKRGNHSSFAASPIASPIALPFSSII